MALIALLLGMPSNVDAQDVVNINGFASSMEMQVDNASQSLSSTRNDAPQVKEHNVLALICMYKYFYYRGVSCVSYLAGTPLYYKTGNSRSIIKINGYKKVSKFGETTKGDLAWTRECSYENGRLKNIRYSDEDWRKNITAGDVDIYEYDDAGRIVRVTRYNSNGDYKAKVEFRAYSKSFDFYNVNNRDAYKKNEFEIKDDGYYFNTDEYSMNLGSFDRSYGYPTYRFKHIVNMQSGYVERIFYWRYEELTMKGRLAGKKYDWHYSDSDRLRFDPECCFFLDNDYIVEYEEVL